MIMNDDIGEIESTDSLNKKSSSFSSDDEPSCQFEACSSNPKLIIAVILILNSC